MDSQEHVNVKFRQRFTFLHAEIKNISIIMNFADKYLKD